MHLYSLCWKQQKVLFSKVIISSVLSIFLQITAFASIIYYSGNIGEVIVFKELRLLLIGSLHEIAIVSLVFIILLVLSFIFQFLSNVGGMRIAIEYEKKTILYFVQSKEMIENVLHFSQKLNNLPILRLLRSDIRAVSRIIRVSLTMFMPLIISIFCFFYLLFNYLIIALIFLLFGLVFLTFQRAISFGTNKSSKQLEKLSPLFSKEIKEIVKKDLNHTTGFQASKAIQKSLLDGIGSNYYYNFFNRIISQFKSSLFTSIYLVIIVIFSILYFILPYFTGNEIDWKQFLIYLIFIRLFMTNLQAFFVKVTIINRFYFQLIRHLDLLFYTISNHSRQLNKSIELNQNNFDRIFDNISSESDDNY